MVPSGKNVKKMGVIRWEFEGRAVENFFATLNISKVGGAIFPKFSGFAGLEGSSLCFGRDVGGGSNFDGRGRESRQKRHCDFRVGHFERLPDIFY